MQNLKRLSAWVPVIAGLYVLVLAAQSGLLAIFTAAVPCALMIAGGVRLLLFPDMQASQPAAIGALLGILLALPLGLLAGRDFGFACVLASAGAFLAAGWAQIRLRPPVDEVPAPAATLAYSAAVALDNVVIGVMSSLTPVPTMAEWREAAAESEAAHDLFRERGYLDDPRSFHQQPAPLAAPQSSPLSIGGHACEHLRFDSDYEPPAELPGRDRWLAYRENRTAHAVILRHGRPAPWLVCVHGFGMGFVKQDFRAFRAAGLHRAGINVALFTLPLHGPGSPAGSMNGENFFGVSPLDFIHAETQAVRDLRRLIAWIRTQEATAVGVHGISLGGYTSALLAGVEAALACVIAGIPVADLIPQLDYMSGSRERRLAAIAGMDRQRDRKVTSVVSPLCMAPQVPLDGRYIYAPTADQFVPTEHVHALWRHWECPHISWCTGGHVTALLQREPRRLVDEAVRISLSGQRAD